MMSVGNAYCFASICSFLVATSVPSLAFLHHGTTKSHISQTVESSKRHYGALFSPSLFLSTSKHYRHHHCPSSNLFAGGSDIGSNISEKQETADRKVVDRGEKEDKTKDDNGLDMERFNADLEKSMEEMMNDDSLTVASSIPWKFRGKHDVFCQVSRPGIRFATCDGFSSSPKTLPVVLLVHGFGCSTVYWRETVKALTKNGYTVYSMDLLGHGKSAKPSDGVVYSTNLWAEQLDDFCRDNLAGGEDIVLVGNSMGSIISLLAATGEFRNKNKNEKEESLASPSSSKHKHGYIRKHIAGIMMFNCGIGMNIHSITRDPKWNPWQRFFLDTIFNVLESTVFGNVALMKWILENVVTKEMLRTTLLQLYGHAVANPELIVDDELVRSFYEPAAKDPESSAKVLSQILTNDAGLTPMEVHAKHQSSFLRNLPIHVLWGEFDTVTPIDGIGEVGQFYSRLAADKNGNEVTLEVVKGGHIPFDEVPDVTNGALLRRLSKLNTTQKFFKKNLLLFDINCEAHW